MRAGNQEIADLIRELVELLPLGTGSTLRIDSSGRASYEKSVTDPKIESVRARALDLLDRMTKPYDGGECPGCRASARHPMYQGDLYCFNCGRIFPRKE